MSSILRGVVLDNIGSTAVMTTLEIAPCECALTLDWWSVAVLPRRKGFDSRGSPSTSLSLPWLRISAGIA
jgi:hypothetical protein